jgi:hypothetical protein
VGRRATTCIAEVPSLMICARAPKVSADWVASNKPSVTVLGAPNANGFRSSPSQPARLSAVAPAFSAVDAGARPRQVGQGASLVHRKSEGLFGDSALLSPGRWSRGCIGRLAMRSQVFATIIFLGLGVLGSCGSSLGGADGRGGAGGAGASGSGGAGAGGATGGAGGTATGGSGGTGGSAGAVGGAAGTGGAGGSAGSSGAGGSHTGGHGGGAGPCGTQSCASNEVCIHPGCGGGVAVCDPLPDGGQCPSGWTQSFCPAPAGRIGCVPGPCTPPAPFCAPLPASCGGSVSCTCLPQNVCGQNGGQCSWIQNGIVMCGFA